MAKIRFQEDIGERFMTSAGAAAQAIRELSDSLRQLKRNRSFEKSKSKFHK